MSSRLLASSNIANLPLVSPMFVLGQDLEFLLLPQAWEEELENICNYIGKTYRRLRLERDLALGKVKQDIGISRLCLAAIENAHLRQRGASFHWYLSYARYLNMTLRDIFGMAVQQAAQDQHLRAQQVSKPLDFAEIADKTQTTIINLRMLKKKVTQENVRKAAQISLSTLAGYPQGKELLKQIADEFYDDQKMQAEEYSEQVFEKVQRAIKHVEDLGEPVTYQAVGKIVGLHPNNFRSYPRVRALLEQKVNYHLTIMERTRRRDQEELLKKVLDAIEELETGGQLVTKAAVARIVGVKKSTLTNKSTINALLEEKTSGITAERLRLTTAREDELLSQVQLAIKQLEDQKLPVSQAAIARQVGVRIEKLRYYPRVKMLLRKVTAEQRANYLVRVTQSEDELIHKVEVAIEELRTSGQPLRAYAIAEKVGLSSVKWYPRVKEMVKRVAKDYQQSESFKRFHEREDELLQKVREAIRHRQNHVFFCKGMCPAHQRSVESSCRLTPDS